LAIEFERRGAVPEAPFVEAIVGAIDGGAYLGANLGLYPSGPTATAGAEIGYNFVPSDNILLGVEGSGLFFLKGGGGNEFWVHAKAGMTMSNFALYGIAGIGEFDFGTNYLWDVGLGAELALNSNWSINREVVGRSLVGSPPTVPHLQMGVRYDF